MSSDVVSIQYTFVYPDAKQASFHLRLDAETLAILNEPNKQPAAWTALEFRQCPNCPLDTTTHAQCPLAINLETLVSQSSEILSYQDVDVEVTTPERTIRKATTAQKALSSLMGVIMPVSGCPHLAFFKPMARFHLPFATEEETIYRSTAMYLLAQYFVRKQGKSDDTELLGLQEIYRNLHLINIAIANRLRAASEMDSSVNALILLDLFVSTMNYVIEDSLEEIQYLFEPYLK